MPGGFGLNAPDTFYTRHGDGCPWRAHWAGRKWHAVPRRVRHALWRPEAACAARGAAGRTGKGGDGSCPCPRPRGVSPSEWLCPPCAEAAPTASSRHSPGQRPRVRETHRPGRRVRGLTSCCVFPSRPVGRSPPRDPVWGKTKPEQQQAEGGRLGSATAVLREGLLSPVCVCVSQEPGLFGRGRASGHSCTRL